MTPIDLHETHGDIETLALSYGGASVTLSFYPNQQTVAWGMELDQAVQKQDYEQMAALLAETVESWDVYDNGKLLPVDADSMMILPLSLMGLMATQMSERASARGRGVRPERSHKEPGGILEAIFGREPREPREINDTKETKEDG